MSVVMTEETRERPAARDAAGARPARHRLARGLWSAVVAGLFALGAWIALAGPAAPLPDAEARPLPSGAKVRVQVDRSGREWLAGRVVTAPLGCTLVRLDDDHRLGMSSVPLPSVRELQRIDAAGQWQALPVAPLLAGEPAGCTAA
jgi:hypothetical protein